MADTKICELCEKEIKRCGMCGRSLKFERVHCHETEETYAKHFCGHCDEKYNEAVIKRAAHQKDAKYTKWIKSI